MKPDFYKSILDNLFDGVYFVDRNRSITYWNKGAEKISGFAAGEVMGKSCADNILRHITICGEELCSEGCPLSKTLEDGQHREAQVFLHHKDGHRVPVALRVSPLFADDGSIMGAVEVFSDASTHVRILNELCELKTKTQTDPLTGLGNRCAAGTEFKRRISELKHHGSRFGLLFVDIDSFKVVNDTQGHEIGDKVLQMVAKTLKSSLRSMDTVFRWGGDEFVVLVPKVNEQVFQSIAERMRRFVEVSPIRKSEGNLTVTVSVGGALARTDDTLTSLAARADAMMYQAKQAGRNCTLLDCDDETSA